MCYVPLDIVTKIRTLIDGKTIPNKVCKGRQIRKPFRTMGVSNFLIGLAEKAVTDVTPSAEDIRWQRQQYRKNMEFRKIADQRVRSGEEKMRVRQRIFEKTGRVVVSRKR